MSESLSGERKHSHVSYSSYIYRVLKDVHPDLGISKRAMQLMDCCVSDVYVRIAREASLLTERIGGTTTLTPREVQTAVRMILYGQLACRAVKEGTKAVNQYHNAPVDKVQSGSTQVRCFASSGPQFPVGKVASTMKNHHLADRIGASSSVYMATVLEFVVAEILTLSGDCARCEKKKNIKPCHIHLAISGNEELNKLFEHMGIAQALLNTHQTLIFKTSKDSDIPKSQEDMVDNE